MTPYEMLLDARRHAAESRRLAQEANELAVASMVHAAHCRVVAESAHEVVLEATRPNLELAQFNADLSASWAKTTEDHAARARSCWLEAVIGGGSIAEPSNS